ncbi:MAG TPA: hypothetical protein VFU04_08245 [Solirubrobacterales bacterium]|nr:hypothetical protein [Solirubrobacterales bacterium]
MLGRGRRRRVYLLGSLLLLSASLHAPQAYSAPGDPPRGSPAGSVYQLPLQQGREDAAPKGGSNRGDGADPTGGGSDGAGGGTSSGSGAAGTGGEGSGGSDSLYRTENDFGSSSRVPGAPLAAGAGQGAAGSGPGGGTDGGVASGAIAGQEVADSGNTSVPAGLVLLGAIALLAAAVAVLSRRFSRPNG